MVTTPNPSKAAGYLRLPQARRFSGFVATRRAAPWQRDRARHRIVDGHTLEFSGSGDWKVISESDDGYLGRPSRSHKRSARAPRRRLWASARSDSSLREVSPLPAMASEHPPVLVESGQLSPAERHARDLYFVRQVLAGDAAALDLLPGRLTCLPAMVRHQNQKLGGLLSETDLEDAVRDTVAAVWAKLPTFEGRASLETWIYRFAFLEVLKAMQRRCRAPKALEESDSHTLPAASEGEDQDPPFDGKALSDGLSRLTRAAAEVIRMRHFENQSFDAIAFRLGVGENTVKARYYRGLARLKEVLERKQRRGEV